MRPSFIKPNKDHWGYFTVGAYKTYSKLEAIEISAKLGQDLHWHFNDEAYDHFDWTHEPPGDLLFWYAERARQLRETYDYLVLMYSGGADSHNILRAFVDNDIYIDEIVQVYAYEGTNNEKFAEANAESFSTSIPQSQYLIEHNPTYKNTKHSMIDGGKFMTTMLDKTNMFDYWYEISNYFYCPWGHMMGNFREISPDYRQLADQGKTIGFIWGVNKPEVTIEKNQFYTEFKEWGVSVFVPPRMQSANPQWFHDEMFYWSPDMPEVVAKQSHIVKRFLEQIDDRSIDGVHVKLHKPLPIEKHQSLTISYRGVFEKNGKQIELTEQGLHALIYPYWNHVSVTTPKPPSPFFGNKDNWLWKSNVPSKGLNRYYMGVPWLRQHVKNLRPDLWWEKPFDPTVARYCGGMKNFGRRYKLSK